MRIAYLCKRRYMSKDVIVDRYARLYEIPYQLARLGHDVQGFCLSYGGGTQEGQWEHDAQPGRLVWRSRNLASSFPSYPWRLLSGLRAFTPDLIFSASDIPHVVLGRWFAKRLRVPLAVDLYDNFEGFGQARIPGMVPALRRAVPRADLVTTTSEPLRRLVVDGYCATGDVVAMPSTVDRSIFRPRDKAACRAALGLPMQGMLIGTAGGLYRDKGIAALYEAWPLVAAARPDVHLVLAGLSEAAMPVPEGDRVHYLGALSHERVAELFCALDVGAICILDTPFGRYCFPQKAYEMLACNLPVVAANVGAMGALFSGTPQCLYRAGDSRDLASKLLEQLATPQHHDIIIEDWRQIIERLEPRLQRIVAGA